MRNYRIGAAALIAIFTGACAAATGDPYGGFDSDVDGRLDYDEYEMGARDAGYFTAWDLDRDGSLNPTELREGYMEAGVQLSYNADVWDLNEDGRIAEEEFYEGNFHELDRNDDNYLDDTEFVDTRM